jgi:hypothetical protein
LQRPGARGYRRAVAGGEVGPAGPGGERLSGLSAPAPVPTR